MRIRVNGEEKDVLSMLSIFALIADSGVASPDMVSVQLNGEFTPKGAWSETLVREGDEIDFLYFLGGGASQ